MKLEYVGIDFDGLGYLDRIRALELGTVSPEGIDLEVKSFELSALFQRVAQKADFDVAEMSASTYLMMRAVGDDRLVGLPVFVSRAFRHNMVVVNTESGIDGPADLRGKRVGVPTYQMTAAVWVRAALEHDYGVSPTEIEWWQGGYFSTDYEERRAHDTPPGVQLKHNPDKSLRQMLMDGEIDAVLSFDASYYKQFAPRLRRLFPNYREVERDYFQRTGIFPVMHMVVLRKDIYDANPWVATSLMEAFVRAKRMGLRRLRDMNALAIAMPWIEDDLDEIDEVFGGDAFPYGFAQNRRVIEAMAQYAYEQGLAHRLVAPEELFARELIDHPGDAMP